MRVQVVGAAAGGVGFPLSTFVLDGVLAVDAGALGWFAGPEHQAAVRDVLLTHSHIDHLAGLPIFLDNVYRLAPRPPTIHALEPTLAALQAHLFNDQIFPDFVQLSRTLPAFLDLEVVRPDRPFTIGHFEIRAFELEHVVPTIGYCIDDGAAAVAIITDTAPVPDVLAELAEFPRLRAVFLEASFPDALADIAEASEHLTVSQFLSGARLFSREVAVYAIHIKPRFYAEIASVIRSAELPNVTAAEPGLIVEV